MTISIYLSPMKPCIFGQVFHHYVRCFPNLFYLTTFNIFLFHPPVLLPGRRGSNLSHKTGLYVGSPIITTHRVYLYRQSRYVNTRTKPSVINYLVYNVPSLHPWPWMTTERNFLYALSIVAQWLALLSHNKKVLGSRCLCWFSLVTPASSYSQRRGKLSQSVTLNFP